ncbi:MAG: Molecular chaperone-like protein, partial [Parcubacteria group bacterium GW2011_GWA2_36_10]
FLFQAIERAKIDLSTTDKTEILFSERDLHIAESVHRLEFEQIVQDLLRRIGDKIDLAVAQAGVHREDIDLVLTTGGTSYIPCVRDLFAVRFGQEKIQQIDAYTSVAHGLGLSASMILS